MPFELIAQLRGALGGRVAADDLAIEVAERFSNHAGDNDKSDEDEGIEDGVQEVWEGRVEIEDEGYCAVEDGDTGLEI